MSRRVTKKELWAQVRTRLEEIAGDLRSKSRKDLEKLHHAPESEQMSFGKLSIQITAWAEPHEGDYLAVFVDGWRTRILGWHQSTAVGFLVDPQGNIEEMEDKDFWEHGY